MNFLKKYRIFKPWAENQEFDVELYKEYMQTRKCPRHWDLHRPKLRHLSGQKVATGPEDLGIGRGRATPAVGDRRRKGKGQRSCSCHRGTVPDLHRCRGSREENPSGFLGLL